MPRMEALERMMPGKDMMGMVPEQGPEMPPPEDEGPVTLIDVVSALEEIIGTLPEEKRADVSQALDILRQVAADKPPEGEMSEVKPQEDGMPPAGEEGL